MVTRKRKNPPECGQPIHKATRISMKDEAARSRSESLGDIWKDASNTAWNAIKGAGVATWHNFFSSTPSSSTSGVPDPLGEIKFLESYGTKLEVNEQQLGSSSDPVVYEQHQVERLPKSVMTCGGQEKLPKAQIKPVPLTANSLVLADISERPSSSDSRQHHHASIKFKKRRSLSQKLVPDTLQPSVTNSAHPSPPNLPFSPLHAPEEALQTDISFNGLPRSYKTRPHILRRQHKKQVEDDRLVERQRMMEQLYRLKVQTGYTSDFATFVGWVEKTKMMDRRTQNLLPISSSTADLSSSTLELDTTRQRSQSLTSLREEPDELKEDIDFLHRALDKIKATLREPKPPKPATPFHDALQQGYRLKSRTLDMRFQRKKLPTCLTKEAESFVSLLLRRQGVISKFAKEQVTSQDISRLQPAQWLNDEIINFYGALIMARSEVSSKEFKNKFLRVHFFNTFFWTKLIREGYEKGRLAKWTKKINIFEKDVVLIPVNHNNAHWTGAVINFRLKRIESYDSMGYQRHDVFKVLRGYLNSESISKTGKPFDFTEWQDFSSKDTPQQENGYDCGVFTCQFLESLSRGVEVQDFEFSQKNMKYLRQRMIWEIGNAALWEVD